MSAVKIRVDARDESGARIGRMIIGSQQIGESGDLPKVVRDQYGSTWVLSHAGTDIVHYRRQRCAEAEFNPRL